MKMKVPFLNAVHSPLFHSLSEPGAGDRAFFLTLSFRFTKQPSPSPVKIFDVFPPVKLLSCWAVSLPMSEIEVLRHYSIERSIIRELRLRLIQLFSTLYIHLSLIYSLSESGAGGRASFLTMSFRFTKP
jgi:hypothetical protein